MLRDQGQRGGQRVPCLQIEAWTLLNAGMPRLLQRLQHIPLPWVALVEPHADEALVLRDRQDIALIEGALRAAADEAGMKHQRM